MAHKTLVGGTAYEVNGGKCLVGGTAYSIQKGRTLIGGTGYDISFGPSAIPVKITGAGSSSQCYVTINGTLYSSTTSGLEVFAGDVISFTVQSTGSANKSWIQIDGVTVYEGTSRKTYSWAVPVCASVNIALIYTQLSMTNRYSRIIVTTT